MDLNSFFAAISDVLYAYVLIFLLIASGLYFSIKSSFVQLLAPFKSIKILKKKNKDSISSLETFALTTAAKVGIGNIIGVSIALSSGGAGSLFWMWVVAFLGGASAFVESTLAQVYKQKDGNVFKGGPAYYIYYGLGYKKLSIMFAIFLILADLIGFNGVLGFSINNTICELFNLDFNSNAKIFTGIFVSLIACVIFKYGMKLSLIFIVIMSIGYFALALWVLFDNYFKIFDVIKLVFKSAFDYEAIFGGFFGSAIIVGAKRGLFSNEAGMGSAPNAAASANVDHPCEQGFVQSFSVLIDLLICTATAVLVLFSNSFLQGVQKDKLIQALMYEYFGDFGFYFIGVFILLFGLSSFYGNYYYSKANLKFICTKKIYFYIFNICAVIFVFIGSQLKLDLVINIADVLMGFMCILNICALFLLRKVFFKTLQSYNKSIGFNPEKLGIKNATCWR